MVQNLVKSYKKSLDAILVFVNLLLLENCSFVPREPGNASVGVSNQAITQTSWC